MGGDRGRSRRERKDRKPTVRDVAAAAGVSPSAVSLALRGRSGLAEETRARIVRVAKELNYVPNLVARSLVEQRSRCVGMMIPNFENRLFPEIAAGAEEVLRERGYSLTVTPTSDDPEIEAEGIRNIIARGMDGIITSSALLGNDNIPRLVERRYPVVCVVRRVPDCPGLDWVVVDNVRGAYFAMEHLIRLGHRRIQVLRGPADNQVAHERFEGATLAARDYGVDLEEKHLFQGPFNKVFGYQAATQILSLPARHRPDAIVAGNDDHALGAFEAIVAAGLEPGRDIALVGFNNIETTGLRRIEITTVTQRSREMGRLAATRLTDVIEGRNRPRRPRQVVMEPELVVRATCGFGRERGYVRDDAPGRFRKPAGEAGSGLARAG